jgi:hypothetical protein
MRILVVTGSRALDADARSRFWAKSAITESFVNHLPGLVVHGGARGPDTWAEEFAAWLGLPRVWFGVGGAGLAVLRLPNGHARKIVDAERYAYASRDPLARNDAMIRWAADQAARGHAVKVVGLLAPWTNSGGTAYTLVAARNHDLSVRTFEAPAEVWPEGEYEGA